MLALFNHFFETIEFDHRCSSSFISLIPKVGNPSNLNGFRLISLLRWTHKFITRFLAAKLKGVIGKLVGDTQSVFINGRNIFQEWKLTYEVLDAIMI